MLNKKLVFILLSAGLILPVFGQQRYYDEIIGNLTTQTKLLQDENARLENKVIATEQQLAAVRRENQAIREELNDIREMVKKDAAVRDAELKKLFAQLDKLSKMPPPPPPMPAASVSVKPSYTAGPEKYEEYVVTSGVTLSAISKAYGVPVSEIKRANNLKSDSLRVNQKLKIPVK